jgi:hypothetical protein
MSVKKKVKCLVSRLLVALGLKSAESCKAPPLAASEVKKPVAAVKKAAAARKPKAK